MGRYELLLIFLISVLMFLDSFNMPLCAVCFFGEKPSFISEKEEMSFEGVIATEPQIRYKNQHAIMRQGYRNILIIINRYQKLSYGDKVVVRGEISIPKNIGSFDYQGYLARRGIRGLMFYPKVEKLESQRLEVRKFIYLLKDRLRGPILTGLPEPHASYLLAMTVGDDWRIPPSFRQALINSGTIHIVSISGLHMSIIAIVLFILFILLGFTRMTATFATFIVLIFYIGMVGNPSAAIRSGIMSMIFLGGYLLGKVNRLFYALLLAAFFMLLWDIKYIYDIGFELSFGAMTGLAIFYPQFRKRFYKIPYLNNKEHTLFDIFVASIAVSVMIFPILAYHFGRISWISPIANVFILPFMPPTMILGFLAEITGFFIQPLWLLLEYQVRMISLFGSLL